MYQVKKNPEMRKWEDLRESNLQEGQEADGRITLKWICGRWVVMLVTGCILLKIGINGDLG